MGLRVWCLRDRWKGHRVSPDWGDLAGGDEVKDRGQTGFDHFLRGGDDFWVFVYGGAEFLLDIADEDGRVSLV